MEGEGNGKSSNYFLNQFYKYVKTSYLLPPAYFVDNVLNTWKPNQRITRLQSWKRTGHYLMSLPHFANESWRGESSDVSQVTPPLLPPG